MEPQQVIGRYALFDAIAAGGMATVHYGRLLGPVGFARTVAIKQLHPQFARDPDFVSMFVDEARLAAKLRHPNVVPVLDVVKHGRELYIIMDYVLGVSLSEVLRRLSVYGERIPVPVVVAILAGTLRAVREGGGRQAHRQARRLLLALTVFERDEHVLVDRPAARQQRTHRLEELFGGLVALGRVLREATMADRGDLRGNPRRVVLHGRGGLGADHEDELAERGGVLERRLAAERLVHHRAQRIDVRAVIDLPFPTGLLGGYVERRAEEVPGLGEVHPLLALRLIHLDLGDAEVEELDDHLARVAAREEQIVGLDVAMDDVGLVSLLQPEAGLRDDAQRQVGRDRAHALEEVLEILALHVLHREERQPAVPIDARVENLGDVLGVDRPRRACLALEPTEDLTVLGQIGGVDDFDGATATGGGVLR